MWRRDRPLAGSSGEWITPCLIPQRPEAAGPGTRSDHPGEGVDRTSHVGKNKTWTVWFWTHWLSSGLLLTSEWTFNDKRICRELLLNLCRNGSGTSYQFQFPVYSHVSNNISPSLAKSIGLLLKHRLHCGLFSSILVYHSDATQSARVFTFKIKQLKCAELMEKPGTAL